MSKKFLSKASILFLLCLSLLIGISDKAWAGTWENKGSWPQGDEYDAWLIIPDGNGTVYIVGSSGSTGYYNGSWINSGWWLGTYNQAYEAAIDKNGTLWSAGGSGYTGTWNGSSWVSKGSWGLAGDIQALTATPDGTVWAGGSTGNTAQWNGSSWISRGQWPHGSYYSETVEVGKAK